MQKTAIFVSALFLLAATTHAFPIFQFLTEAQVQPQNASDSSLDIHYINCFEDLKALIPDIEALAQAIQAQSMSDSLKDAVIILQKAAGIIGDCGINVTTLEEAILKNAPECLEEIEIIEPSLALIIQEIETKNATLKEVGEQLVNIYLQDGQTFMQDCGMRTLKGSYDAECVDELLTVLKDLVVAVIDYENNANWKAEVKDLLQKLSDTLNDCKSKTDF